MAGRKLTSERDVPAHHRKEIAAATPTTTKPRAQPVNERFISDRFKAVRIPSGERGSKDGFSF